MSFTSWLQTYRPTCSSRAPHFVCATALAAITLTTPSASAAYVTVYGGPTYAPGVGGFKGLVTVDGVNNGGAAVGTAEKFDGTDVRIGSRAVRWDASGAAPTELANLGTNASGYTSTVGRAINDAGTVVGAANKYDDLGAELGNSAVRWDASGVATELGSLGLGLNGITGGAAYAINAAGIAVGFAVRYDGSGAFSAGAPSTGDSTARRSTSARSSTRTAAGRSTLPPRSATRAGSPATACSIPTAPAGRRRTTACS
jgi:hypothetical protein